VDGEYGTQAIYLNNDGDMVIPMKMRAALFCFEHWKQGTPQIHESMPTQYLTNIGPWELQTYYDADESMELALGPVMVAYDSSVNNTNTLT